MADVVIPVIPAVSSWDAPQPSLSEGLLVVYGGQQLVQANAEWRGYDLTRIPQQCGLASISPAHLGRLAWVRVPGGAWVGPCTVVDVVSRHHAYESIYVRREVAEVSRVTAARLGFANGGRIGQVWFGACPPPDHVEPRAYAPPLAWDYSPRDWTPSYYPYPAQQLPVSCD